MAWQPIETAPKDATIVLGCDTDGDYLPYTMRYINNDFDNKPTEPQWYDPLWIGSYDPEFWMPLPEPPKVPL